jgi:exopolyphosphatase/guanosine-5'-triphosphate,3'-diphosphate pyrophosphatase
MFVYDTSGKKLKRIFKQKEYAELIRYIDDGKLNKKGIKKLTGTLKTFKLICDLISIKEINCFATASLRKISNSQEVLSTVKRRAGIDINIISGKEEAELGYDGLNYAFGLEGSGMAMDMGGGSTELLLYNGENILNAVSLDVGSLALFQQYIFGLFPTDEEIETIREHIKNEVLSQAVWLSEGAPVSAHLSGGTARAIARLHRAIIKGTTDIHGYNMSIADIQMVYDTINKRDNYAITLLTEIMPERIHIILPGMFAYLELFKICNISDITISDYGVREGYMLKCMRTNTLTI